MTELFKGPLSATSLVFVYMQEFGYYTLFGAGQNKGNHCETTVIIKQTFRNSTYSKADFTSPCNVNYFNEWYRKQGRLTAVL